MDRIIKFRGKNSKGEWIYGGATGTGNSFIVDVSVDAYLMNSIFCPILPETFGQLTGLKDIDGKEIFEGDIIQNQEYPELIYCVEMIGGCWSVDYHEDGDFDSVALNWLLTMAPFKIIGNIHDNPELLEVMNYDI